MAQRSRFFDDNAGDRIYSADAWAQVFAALMRDGVVASLGAELAVTEDAPPSMNVSVATGSAFVQGRYFEVFGSAEELTLAAADATNPRIDRIVVRVDTAGRQAILAILAGAPAAAPVAPALTQTPGGTWELPLARVAVAAGAASVVNANITDERGERAQGPDIAAILAGATGHRHEGTNGTGRKVRHADVEGVTADQHHGRSHDHAGDAANVGAMTHAGTTGKGPNDHHNENHIARHAAGGADQISSLGPITVTPQDLGNAGGKIILEGAGANADGVVDNFQGRVRLLAGQTGFEEFAVGVDEAWIRGNRVPRIGSAGGKVFFVQTGDPGGVAIEGDVWIKA